MKNLRFLSITAILVIVLATIIGTSAASAQAVCSPATAISVPFVKDGPGTFCYEASSMCYALNSWNMNLVQINGNNYTNIWVSGPSIPALNGVFTITYNGGQFGHFEIAGPCGSVPTNTNTPPGATATRTRTPTGTGTGRSQTPAFTPVTRTITPNGFTATRTPTSTPSLTPTRSNTPQPITNTRTPQGQGISLKAQYMPGNTNASTTAIQPKIRIVNTGSVSVPLASIGVQYWYTWNGTQPHDFSQETVTCISTTIPGGCANPYIESGAIPLNPAHTGGDSVVVNTFQLIGTAEIAPGQSYDIEYRLTKNDGSLYNQTDDYSFNASFTTYTDWPKITLFHQALGSLWGVKPIVPTPTITPGPSPTATLPGGICAPVTATIAAPFVHDGPIVACWKTNDIGVGMNSWNNSLVSVNGVNVSNQFVALASMPPQIDGFWYISQSCTFTFCHIELMDDF